MIYIIGLIGVVFGIILDQYTKHLAITHLKSKPITLIDGVFELQYLENRGAAFGMLQNQQIFFLVIGCITLLVMLYLYIRMPREKRYIPLRICMISIAAGAIGNMIDRVRYKYVVDFLYFKLIDFPIFNVADIFASVATVVLMFLFIFYYKEEEIDHIYKLLIPKRKKNQTQAD